MPTRIIPHTILIVATSIEDPKFIQVKLLLSRALGNQFAISLWTPNDNIAPNSDAVALVVSTLNQIDSHILQRALQYYHSGGKLVSKSLSSDQQGLITGSCVKQDKLGLIFCQGEGAWIETNLGVDEISLEDFQEMLNRLLRRNPILTSHNKCAAYSITSGNLVGKSEDLADFKTRLLAIAKDGKVKQTNCTLDFSPNDDSPSPSEKYIPIFECEPSTFDWKKFSAELKTNSLGRVLIHTQIARTTFDFVDGIALMKHGFTVIADRQTGGKGRAGNTWLSPEGCAMFSMQLEVQNPSRASLLQHVVALAAVHGIRTMEGYQDLDFRLKWPNDIYFGRQSKVGGAIAFSSFFRNKLTCNIGMGVNLSNEHPTVCINKVIEEWNCSHSGNNPLVPISRETYFARTFNFIESFIEKMDSPAGWKTISDLYHKYWLHKDQEVTLMTEESEGECRGTIVGLDESGFLVVRLLGDNRLVSVQPDGNSYDMMQGLILPKVRKS